jgi:transcription termination factor Rho
VLVSASYYGCCYGLLRKVQQNYKDHSLQLNLPKSFERIVNLQKGDYLQCKVMNLKSGKNILLVEKLLANGNSSTEEATTTEIGFTT